MRVSFLFLSAVLSLLVLGCASGLTNEEIESTVKAEVARAIAELRERTTWRTGGGGPHRSSRDSR